MRRVAIVAAIWTVVGLMFALQLRLDASYSGRQITGAQAVVLSLSGWYGWALLSPLVIWLARRLGTTKRGIVIHIAVAVGLTFVKTVITTEVLRRSGMSPRLLLVNIPINLLTYAGIVAATHAIDGRRLLTVARLELLKTQMEPHFLFNTLHSIAELMHQDVAAADRMLTRLSELLRATLDAGSRHEVRLAEELALVERYLDIERLRLGDRLKSKIDVDPRALDARVPILMLQPIVENAIRHGIAPRPAGGTVTLTIRAERDRVRIDIDDDGPGFRDGGAERLGLRNTRARLEQLYGRSQQLVIGQSALGGASVNIMLPLRT
jgi:two-component sensor histidine kinase